MHFFYKSLTNVSLKRIMNIVQVEEVMSLNKVVTSKEAILSQCRNLVMDQGIEALNMRSVAAACGVALGSIYNYFPSKSDLIRAAVEDVWMDIFHMCGEPFTFTSFTQCLKWLFDSIRAGCEKYPGFFTLHSVSFAADDKKKGRQMMEEYFGHIKASLRNVLDHDPQVRPDAFTGALKETDFIDMMFTLVTSLVLEGASDCGPLLTLAARSIYEGGTSL